MLLFEGRAAFRRSAPKRLFRLNGSQMRKLSAHKSAFTLVELLVVIAIIGILVALLLPAIQAAREAARRAQCQSNLHNAALAVLNYESVKKALPNGVTYNTDLITNGNYYSWAGKAIIGPDWIIDILPYMEEQSLHDRFDPNTFKAPYNIIGVNDPTPNSANYIARGTLIPSLVCPSDPYTRTLFADFGGNWARGNYAASVGRGFIGYTGYINGPGDKLSDSTGMGNWANVCARGVIGPNVGIALRRITDGTSKTIMLGEIRAGINEHDSRGVWAIGHAGTSLLAAYGGGSDDGGPNPQFSSGDDVWATGLGGEGKCVARTDMVSVAEGTSGGGASMDQATVRSKHPGGAHVAMCDGSVTYITDDIETTGCYSPTSCCTPWDYMITSGDEGKPGLYNGGNIHVPYCAN
jgi:prepilin-type N-terminal cleavage/methylation domain-containing protein/prepilin-type processing-associated H-X9-DG protein